MSIDLKGFKGEEMIDYKNLMLCVVTKFLKEVQGSKI